MCEPAIADVLAPELQLQTLKITYLENYQVISLNLVAFILSIVVYIFFCYFGVKVYLKTIVAIYESRWSQTTRTLTAGVVFLGFVASILPFAVFAPVWLSMYFKFFLDEQGQEPSGTMFAFGCVILLCIVWTALRSKDGKRFDSVMFGAGKKI